MTAQKSVAAEMPEEFVRFSPSQRAQHFVIMVSLTALVLTGLPQKFAGENWAQTMILAAGGIEVVRLVHRACALAFTLAGVYHAGWISWLVVTGRFTTSMIPGMRDVRNALDAFKYCVGTERAMPKFDRYDYRQKFEYWAVAFGWMVMVGSGLIMMFPAQATQILPGAFIPTAREMHGGEALLVLMVIVTWHLYGANLNPLRFPGDASIFTGKISHKRMMAEHPLEYARIMRDRARQEVPAPTPEEEFLIVGEAELAANGRRDGMDAALSDLMSALREKG